MIKNGNEMSNLVGSLNSGGNVVHIDEYGALMTVSQKYYHIQQGEFFTAASYDASVDIITPKEWYITKDASTDIHWSYVFESDKSGILEFYAMPTVTDNGTEITAYNNNMNSTNTVQGVQFYVDPTVTVDGLLINTRVIGSQGATPIGGSGGTAILDIKNIIGDNMNFLIRFTSDVNATRANFIQYFYETLR